MIRAGVGFDAHAFGSGRDLVLGGVVIPEADGLAGHSDADVLSHAIADACLGAAGLGDLGERFPSDERWKDASSLDILSETARLLTEHGFSVVNVDASILAESPRLSPFRDAMVKNIAGSLGLDSARVSVKSTTTDGLGTVGRGEGMAAFAVVLVEAPEPS